jgi:hypothetical protein
MTTLHWLFLSSVAGLCEAGLPDPQPLATETINRAGVICTATVAPPAVPLIGEVRLSLSAEGDAPLAVEPIVFPNPPGWRVRAAETPLMTDPAGGRQKWRQDFRLVPDRPGELPLPPPAIRVRSGGRETPIDISWQPLTIRVTTTLPRVDLDEARGITGPEPAPPSAPTIWQDERFWAASIVVIAVVAAILAGRGLRSPPAPESPPAEWAAAELDRLGRLEPRDPAAADALAATLRGYLDRRFHVPATGKNTTELLSLLEWVPSDSAADWRSLLERCDIARFAGLEFSNHEWTNALGIARRLMTETLPVREATDSAAASPTGEKA